MIRRLSLFMFFMSALFFFVQGYASGKSSSVTVITAADIKRERPVSIMALLREKVGIDQQGRQVSMRGVKGVVIVLDGVPRTTIPSYLNPEDVERIEIIRGAASARFGASAMGGAVVIRSKRGATWKGELIGAYGSFDRHYEKAVVRGNAGALSFKLMGRLDDIKRTYDIGSKDTPFPHMIYVQPDSNKRQIAEAGLGYRGKRLESDLTMNYDKSSSVQGRPNSTLDSENMAVRWNVKYTPLSWLEIASALYTDYWPEYGGLRDRGNGTDAEGLAPDQVMESCSLSEGMELRVTGKLGKIASCTLGGTYGHDSEKAVDKDYATRKTLFEYRVRSTQEALFLTMETTPFRKINLDLSGRWDRYRYYDVLIDDGLTRIEGQPLSKNSFNPEVGGYWQVSDHIALRASMGMGFIPPSPSNLYYENLSNPGNRTLSNPGLKSEKSFTADVGLDVVFSRIDIGITPFYTLWQDKVEYTYAVSDAVTTRRAENIGESDSKGVEIQLKGSINDEFGAFFNYTYNRTEITKNNADSSVVGNDVPDMPGHKFNAGITYEKQNDYSLKVLWRYVGERFLDQDNTDHDAKGIRWKRNAYHVVDLIAIKRFLFDGFIKGLDLTLSVENLFNLRYDKWFFYRDPGRVVMLETGFKF
jgi:outer membrane receptor protein involved in Fe transport